MSDELQAAIARAVEIRTASRALLRTGDGSRGLIALLQAKCGGDPEVESDIPDRLMRETRPAGRQVQE